MATRHVGPDTILALEWDDFAGPLNDTLSFFVVAGTVIFFVITFFTLAYRGKLQVVHALLAMALTCVMGVAAFLITTVFPYL